MHGSQSTALQQEGLTGMDATADADAFIVVYPQGDIPAGAGYEWNVPGQPLFGGAAVPARSPNDVSFIDQLVSSLEQQYCIDEHRVFATGFSGGARMASQLGCDASAVFAAVAPVSGLRLPRRARRPGRSRWWPSTAPPTRSIPTWGTARSTGPTACRRRPSGGRPTTGVGTAQTSRLATDRGPHAVLAVRRGSEVELYSIVGEGHEWPGGPTCRSAITEVLGPQSAAISANDSDVVVLRGPPAPLTGGPTRRSSRVKERPASGPLPKGCRDRRIRSRERGQP